MDIEGGEYAWIDSLSEAQLNNFKQIVIEIHGTDNSFASKDLKINCLAKLINTHYIVHIHGNNFSPTINNIPNVIELTFVNKNYFTSVPKLNTQALPILGLDFSNMSDGIDVDLNFYPFVNI
jgi:hypothetical protein